MNAELAGRYYRLALSAAVRRDLSGAARYARFARLLDEGQANAAKLLGLCLYELGEPECARYLSAEDGDPPVSENPPASESPPASENPPVSGDTLVSEDPPDSRAPMVSGEGQPPLKDAFDQIRSLAEQGKWRKALRQAESIPHQSVRVLLIQGCLHASAKHFGAASRVFVKALEKDCANPLALAGLAEAAKRRKGSWWNR